jgi:rare lipoprotein A
LADRYTGRHIRQARHGAWVNKKRTRSQPSRQLLPAAAALTVAGILIGGAGAAMQLSAGSGTGSDIDLSAYDPADYPPADPEAMGADRDAADRDALANRTSRDQTRPFVGPTVTNTIEPTAPEAAPPPQTAPLAAVIASGSCGASFYDEGQLTANGENFNPAGLTAAHKSLPFNSQVRVTNIANGKSVTVRINDRGPFVSGRCLDLSKAAFGSIANTGTGVIDVRYEVLAQDAT